MVHVGDPIEFVEMISVTPTSAPAATAILVR